MKAVLDRILHFDLLNRRSRLVRIVFFVVVLLGLLKGLELGTVWYLGKNWDVTVEKETSECLEAVKQAVLAVQRSTRRVGTEVAQSSVVQEYLTGTSDDLDALFAHVSRVSRGQGVGVEVFDRKGVLLAWEGRSGPAHRDAVQKALNGQLVSFVTREPIYSQLFVAAPVRSGNEIVGVVLTRRDIEVNYPLSNRFISRRGLTDQLSQDLGVTVEINFEDGAKPRKDGRYLSEPLFGLDSARIGVASVLRPSRSAYLENVGASYGKISALLAACLVVILALAAGRRTSAFRSTVMAGFAVTIVLWLTRYLLLWLEIPSSLFTSGIFDPVHFASQFGSGLAQSIGEMSLTACALALNVAIVTRLVTNRSKAASPRWIPDQAVLRAGGVIATTALVFLLVRGYAAVVRSAVFDSTLRFGDPREVVPSSEMAVMIANLFIISFCLVVVIVGLTFFLLAVLFRKRQASELRKSGWVVVGIVYAGAAVAFDLVHPNPLTGTWYRLLVAGGILALAYYLRYHLRGRPMLRLGNVFLTLGLAAVLLYPLLEAMVQEKDREKVKVFAGEVLRPIDSWLNFVVDESLWSFTDEETCEILRNGHPEEVQRLAFAHWARSPAGKEGYACIFSVLDIHGSEISRFSIGGQGILIEQLKHMQQRVNARTIQVWEVGSGVNAVKVYAGAIPIESPPGFRLGYGVVIVSARQEALFRGETPAILRSASHENLESFYRPITLSEYRNGVLFTSSNPGLPIGYTVPASVQSDLSRPGKTTVWADEVIDGTRFETFYARRSAETDEVISLSLQSPGLMGYLFNSVRMLIYYAAVVALVLVCALAVQRIRGVAYVFTFRDKLLLALVTTAIVPVVIIALYGRMSATERLMEETAERLELETNAVSANILQRFPGELENGKSSIRRSFAEQLAAELGTDFNVYTGEELQISTRPELYEAGILDRRLNGSVFSRVMLMGKRFHLETESIGLYQYAVGYRPLVTGNGAVVGVVSVPTLYRQNEIDEEVSKRNAFIFGIYAVVLISILIIATALAHRIASPIHLLTLATKKVSQGDLDVRVRVSAADGEIGELVRAFELMTRDLKRSRENIIRFERELAWKEMAKQVAHEIKNPLTPMRLSLQHLRQTYRDKIPDFDKVFNEVSNTIIEQIDALSRIASEFSRFARMPKPKPEQCDVNAILRESVNLFEPDLHVDLRMDLQQDLPLIWADHEELRRTFINVIRNGIQAMDNVGSMVISTRHDKGEVVVTIQDFGTGIPEELKPRLFQPNFSTKTDGMGLGLAIVKKTVDDLGGKISIKSTVGAGTTVTIILPVSRDSGA